MARWDTFTFRVSEDERTMLDSLAAILHRSQSDVCRLAIWQLASRELSGCPQEDNEDQGDDLAE